MREGFQSRYCSCEEPDLAEGYSIGDTGMLRSQGYCETCHMPWMDRKTDSKGDGGA